MPRSPNNWRPGDSVPGKKLSDTDIDAIRSMRGKCRQRDLADYFGVSEAHISNIMRGKKRRARQAFQWPRLQNPVQP